MLGVAVAEKFTCAPVSADAGAVAVQESLHGGGKTVMLPPFTQVLPLTAAVTLQPYVPAAA